MKSNIKLRKGDCLELMKKIPDKSIDMILCDLPYGTTQNKWDSVIDLELLWKQYNRVIKDNGCISLFSQMPFSASLVMSNYKYFRYEWIWEKMKGTGHLNEKKMPLKKHENILIFYKKLPIYNAQMRKGFKPYKCMSGVGSKNYGKQKRVVTDSGDERYPLDVINFGYDSKYKLHPTQKPVALLEYLIKTYTNEKDIVLDNCMGSGSTGVACVNTNRKFVGIEKDSNYYKIAKRRIKEAYFNKCEEK